MRFHRKPISFNLRLSFPNVKIKELMLTVVLERGNLHKTHSLHMGVTGWQVIASNQATMICHVRGEVQRSQIRKGFCQFSMGVKQDCT